MQLDTFIYRVRFLCNKINKNPMSLSGLFRTPWGNRIHLVGHEIGFAKCYIWYELYYIGERYYADVFQYGLYLPQGVPHISSLTTCVFELAHRINIGRWAIWATMRDNHFTRGYDEGGGRGYYDDTCHGCWCYKKNNLCVGSCDYGQTK